MVSGVADLRVNLIGHYSGHTANSVMAVHLKLYSDGSCDLKGRRTNLVRAQHGLSITGCVYWPTIGSLYKLTGRFQTRNDKGAVYAGADTIELVDYEWAIGQRAIGIYDPYPGARIWPGSVSLKTVDRAGEYGRT